MSKIWLDDKRPAPDGYIWVETVGAAIYEIMYREREIDIAFKQYILEGLDWERAATRLKTYYITEISCDNDLGDGEAEGYKLLNWLEATCRNYPIHIHTANPVAAERMREIIERNKWKEVL